MRRILLSLAVSDRTVQDGGRVIEIAAIATEDHQPEGDTFYRLLNPGTEVAEIATKSHGLKQKHLSRQSAFSEVAESFLQIIGDAPIICRTCRFTCPS